MPMSFVIGIIVLILAFLILYFIFTMTGGPAEPPQAEETQPQAPAEEPPQPAESTGEEADPFKSAEPPK